MGYNSEDDNTGLSSFVQLFKVIHGNRSWCQSKAHMYFPISHYKVTLDVSVTVFEILMHLSRK